MADNDQNNDEYKFAELDPLDKEPNALELNLEDSNSVNDLKGMPGKKDVKRNALIVVGLIIFGILMYKLIGGIFFAKSKAISPKEGIAVSSPQAVQTKIAPESPVQVPIQPLVAEADPALKRKMESIEASQKNLQNDFTTLSEQVVDINNNIANLSTQMSKIDQAVADLSNRLNKQSEVLNVLILRSQPKQVKHVARSYQPSPTIYYINAIIPGRAWLIGTNGSTITISEGAKIAGYGVVKLIDPLEGRVLTSSGREIRFSQEDS